MATTRAAQALLWDQDIGSLEVGKAADITLVEISAARYSLFEDPLLALMRIGSCEDVSDVVVNGRLLIEDRQVLGVDEREVIEQASAASRSFLARLHAFG